MSEIILFTPENQINNRDIFDISRTETIISCMYGQDSSPKIVRNLMSQNNNDFRCLSGGIYGLAYYFNDRNLILQTDAATYDPELEKTILRQTDKRPGRYYKDLEEKTLIVITHSPFLDIKRTYSGQMLLEEFGVKEILSFPEEKDLEKYLGYLPNVPIIRKKRS